jgi:hypothetical protein
MLAMRLIEPIFTPSAPCPGGGSARGVAVIATNAPSRQHGHRERFAAPLVHQHVERDLRRDDHAIDGVDNIARRQTGKLRRAVLGDALDLVVSTGVTELDVSALLTALGVGARQVITAPSRMIIRPDALSGAAVAGIVQAGVGDRPALAPARHPPSAAHRPPPGRALRRPRLTVEKRGEPAEAGVPNMALAAKKMIASMKFISGPAIRVAARAPRLAALKEPGDMSPASSPFMRAKPPNGSQFSVKSVPS